MRVGGRLLLYTNTAGRLNYTIGSEVITLQHLDRPLYIVGYIKKDNRIYLIDREANIVSYQLLLAVVEYQTAVVRRDFEAAAATLPKVPREEYNRIARFLEAQGFKEEALAVATDPEHQFELAVGLGKLQAAYEYTIAQPAEAKWKQIADLALMASNVALAEECLVRAADLPGLLLLYSSTGHAEGIERLAQLARAKGNIAFICLFLRGQTEGCLQLLLDAGRAPEAAFFTRTYLPSKMSDVVALKAGLVAVNPKAAESIADPIDYPNLFHGLDDALKAREWLTGHVLHEAPAAIYPDHALDNESDLIEHMKLMASAAAAPPAEAEEAEDAAAVAAEAAEAAEATEDGEEQFEDAAADEPADEPEAVDEAAALEAELDASLAAEEPAADAAADLEAELDAELDAELS